ncbi:hypothetical protein PENTCL1PPCAC_3378 [Pristionchus entomophagus]|uniref:Dehydrogenase n=1 Tax=Pristionchus entomophagus TaxID=358040 RepID=A0AAV5SG89_9BILA|nr:hypothetical protein PENTCL1PPCAC_3378 [Pristionchus entomophagus]
MAARRLIAGLTSPWSIGFSTFGIAYGFYHIWDSTQSGRSYELAEDLTGKTYIVTGATSGIGQATAEELAKRNARVIMACRNRDKCVEVRRDIVLNTRNKQVYCRQCDLSDFDSVVTFVSKLSKGKFELDRIDGIIHNAAVMENERRVNKDGIEKTLATNHLGAFLMTGLMLEKLQSQSHPVRLVFVNTNLIGRKTALNFANFNEELQPKEAECEEEKARPKKWDGYEVYKRSKLAEAMFARDLSEKLKDSNISVTMADPGRAKSNLSSQLDAQTFFLSRWMLKPVSFLMGERKTEKAVRPVLYAVADPSMDGKTGLFIDRERAEQEWGENVENPDSRRRLWAVSERWTRFPDRLCELDRQINGGDTTKLPVERDPPKVIDTSSGRSWKTLWLW